MNYIIRNQRELMNFVSDFIKAKVPHRRKHQKRLLKLVPIKRDAKARKIPMLGQVNVSCTIKNV